MTVTLTPAAVAKINALCNEHNTSVRLSIESGGCNGFSKKWGFSQFIEESDVVFTCDTGKLIIDQISLDIIENAVIDYKDDLGGSFFSVAVPAAKTSCGCGISFSI